MQIPVPTYVRDALRQMPGGTYAEKLERLIASGAPTVGPVVVTGLKLPDRLVERLDALPGASRASKIAALVARPQLAVGDTVQGAQVIHVGPDLIVFGASITTSGGKTGTCFFPAAIADLKADA